MNGWLSFTAFFGQRTSGACNPYTWYESWNQNLHTLEPLSSLTYKTHNLQVTINLRKKRIKGNTKTRASINMIKLTSHWTEIIHQFTMFLLILNYPRTEIEPRAAIANQPDISGDGTWKYYRTRPHGWMWPPSQKTPAPTQTIAKLDNAYPLNDIAVYTLYRYCLDNVDMIVWQHAHDMGIMLTHLPLVPHMYASVNWINIGSGKGLAPIRRQAITWTTVHVLSNGLSEKKISEIRINIQNFLFKKMHLKMSSAK